LNRATSSRQEYLPVSRSALLSTDRTKEPHMTQEIKRAIVTIAAPTPRFGYSQGIVTGDFLYVAGQVGIDPQTREPAGDFAARVHRALQNVAQSPPRSLLHSNLPVIARQRML
jgi:hypothetical protein